MVSARACIPGYRAQIVQCNNEFSDESREASYWRTSDSEKYKHLSHVIIKKRADCKEKAKQTWKDCSRVLPKKAKPEPVPIFDEHDPVKQYIG